MTDRYCMEEIQGLIELNDKQTKAFKELKKAVEKCKEANIYFYQNLETLGLLNGNNVTGVVCRDSRTFQDAVPECVFNEDRCLQFLSYDSVVTVSPDRS